MAVCLRKFLPISDKLSITKFLKQNAVDCWSRLTTEITLKVEEKIHYFENKHNFPFPPKNAWGTRRDKHTKNSKAIIMLALCPGRCLLHHKGIGNDQTIFFHVTAGNVKFAVSQWSNSHLFNFLYETRLFRGNAILEILNSKLKTNY